MIKRGASQGLVPKLLINTTLYCSPNQSTWHLLSIASVHDSGRRTHVIWALDFTWCSNLVLPGIKLWDGAWGAGSLFPMLWGSVLVEGKIRKEDWAEAEVGLWCRLQSNLGDSGTGTGVALQSCPSGNKTFISFFFFLFSAASVVYGGSQARDPIGATAARHSHSHAGSEPCLWPTP